MTRQTLELLGGRRELRRLRGDRHHRPLRQRAAQGSWSSAGRSSGQRCGAHQLAGGHRRARPASASSAPSCRWTTTSPIPRSARGRASARPRDRASSACITARPEQLHRVRGVDRAHAAARAACSSCATTTSRRRRWTRSWRLAHTVFNAGLGVPWEDNRQERRHFAPIVDWSRRLTAAGFRDTGKRLLQAHDPTDNVLMAFVKQ